MNQKDNWIIFSPTDVFSGHHDYELFLLQKKLDAPNDNLNHQDIHNCENQDDILIHATNISNTFELPQFMAQHNCEDLDPTDATSAVPTAFQASSDHTFDSKCAHNLLATKCNQSQNLSPSPNHNFSVPQLMAQHNCTDLDPTDDPSAVPTASQASCDQIFNPKCAHNPIASQCNQSEYLTLMKPNCAHNPSASQVSQTNLSNSLCWKPSSLLSNVHFRNTTKNCSTSSFALNFVYLYF